MDERRLRRDFRAACDAMTAADFDALRTASVGFDAITRAGMVGMLEIVPHGRTFTTTAANGLRAFILACWWPEAPGLYSGIPFPEAVVDDLIAFDLEGRWWYRHGARDQVLGPARLAEAFDAEWSSISPSPLAWLQGGCQGYCPLGLLEESLELYSSTTWRSSAEGAAA